MFRIQPVVRLPRAFAPIKEFRQDDRAPRHRTVQSWEFMQLSPDILLLSGPALVAEVASVMH